MCNYNKIPLDNTENVKLKAIYCILYEYDQLIYNIKHKTTVSSLILFSYYLVQIVFVYKV